jgi:phosphohistidine phosphatase
MELILWRHCEAADITPDLARPLTSHGTDQARRMAAWLQSRLSANANTNSNIRLLVSPALRTTQTAAALTTLHNYPLQVLNALAPGSTANEVLQAIGWPQLTGTVIVVGHQPTLGLVASRLITGTERGWLVDKGAIWWLVGAGGGSSGHAMLKAMLPPELV